MKVTNALVTWNDLATMGLTAKGTPPTGLGVANKAELISAYYVNEAASPFSTYTADRCPPYQTIQNTTTTTTTISPNICFYYYVYADDGTQDRNAYYYSYINCSGVTVNGSRVNQGPGITICAQQGTVTSESFAIYAEEGGPCSAPPIIISMSSSASCSSSPCFNNGSGTTTWPCSGRVAINLTNPPSPYSIDVNFTSVGGGTSSASVVYVSSVPYLQLNFDSSGHQLNVTLYLKNSSGTIVATSSRDTFAPNSTFNSGLPTCQTTTTTTTTAPYYPTLTCYTISSSTTYLDGCNGSVNLQEVYTVVLKDQFGNPIVAPYNITFEFSYDYGSVDELPICENSGTSTATLNIYAGNTSGQYTFNTYTHQYCCYSGTCNGSCYSYQDNITYLSNSAELSLC